MIRLVFKRNDQEADTIFVKNEVYAEMVAGRITSMNYDSVVHARLEKMREYH